MKLMKLFKNIKYKTKLSISYFLVAIFPVLILGIYSYNQSENILYQEIQKNIGDTVQHITNILSIKCENISNVAQSIAVNTQIQQIFSEDHFNYFELAEQLTFGMDPLISSLSKVNEDIEHITIYAENVIPEHGKSILDSKRVKKELWYKGSNNFTQFYIGDNAIFATMELTNFSSNKKIGVIYIEIDSNELFKEISLMKNTDTEITISDSNIEKPYYINTGTKDFNPKRFVSAIGIVNISNWNVRGKTKIDYGRIDLNNIILATIIIISVCIFIVFFLIKLFSYSFVKRIVHLNAKIQKVSDGDLSVEVKSNSKDELGQLSNGFGIMLKSIRDLIAEVYENKLKQNEAEFKALQSQINPHFLYNTLSIINWKAIDIGNDEISNITTSLSKFYRTMLNHGERDTTVKNELENIQAYITIQLSVHDNKFRVIYDFDESLMECKILNMILQPIVENAIEHGIDMVTYGIGQITIKSMEKDNNICFQIDDNGPGIYPDQLHILLSKDSSGYGLKNVQERIKMTFGEQYGLFISSVVGTGTSVLVILPKV